MKCFIIQPDTPEIAPPKGPILSFTKSVHTSSASIIGVKKYFYLETFLQQR
jgi:hypothetical protein